MRLDLFLVKFKLAHSRAHAQELIKSGQVYEKKLGIKTILKKANHLVEENQQDIYVERGPANRYVSRGGLKLEGALLTTGIVPQGQRVLDVGISTGGFSDCLLQNGASFVLGVDVGHGQLHRSLFNNANLKLIEGMNAREIDSDPRVLALRPPGGFDLVVMDVSFISITLIVPRLMPLLKQGGFLLSLVKPQFEVGPEGLGKGGIVKDSGLFLDVEDKVKGVCQVSGFRVRNYFASPIEGKDGNKEFFILAQK